MERAIRARVEAIYNRPETDFADRAAYDDYLEEREDIIFNLTEGIDVAATEAKLTAYSAANAASIAAHAAAAAEAVRAADAAAAPAPVDDAPAAGPSTSYAPTAAAAVAPALPVPTAVPPPPPSEPMTDAARRAMGAASGWDKDAARKAGILDALRTLFV